MERIHRRIAVFPRTHGPRRRNIVPYLLVAPLAAVFLLFLVAPLVLTVVVSFWDYSEYELIPRFTLQNYRDVFSGCLSDLPDLCVAFKVYWSTVKLCLAAWSLTLVIGFGVAYFLRFHVRGTVAQAVLLLLCTIPFWTSNVIRTMSLVPLLGRYGLLNEGLLGLRLVRQPQDWMLFSGFSVVTAFAHLYTLYMIVPIYNSMKRIEEGILEASRDAGAGEWRTLFGVVVPLCKPGIAIGSIFVLTAVMGDFVTVGMMGGQQISSIGKVIEVEMSYLQFPAAAANAVVLLGTVLLLVLGLTRTVDVRKEL